MLPLPSRVSNRLLLALNDNAASSDLRDLLDAPRSLVEAAAVVLASPTNTLADGNSVLDDMGIPTAGLWLLTSTVSLSRNGVVAGTLNQQTVFTQYTKNGVPLVVAGALLAAPPLTVDLFAYQTLHRFIAAFQAGDRVGLNFGFGGAQAAGLTAKANAMMTAEPIQAGG